MVRPGVKIQVLLYLNRQLQKRERTGEERGSLRADHSSLLRIRSFSIIPIAF